MRIRSDRARRLRDPTKHAVSLVGSKECVEYDNVRLSFRAAPRSPRPSPEPPCCFSFSMSSGVISTSPTWELSR